jgi:thioredoxin 1
MELKTLSEPELDALLRSEVPVLVDFATNWCPPCRALAPILTALAREREGRLRLVSVDAEASEWLARRYDVRAFPTVISFVEGRENARAVGLMPKEKLLKLLRI